MWLIYAPISTIFVWNAENAEVQQLHTSLTPRWGAVQWRKGYCRCYFPMEEDATGAEGKPGKEGCATEWNDGRQ